MFCKLPTHVPAAPQPPLFAPPRVQIVPSAQISANTLSPFASHTLVAVYASTTEQVGAINGPTFWMYATFPVALAIPTRVTSARRFPEFVSESAGGSTLSSVSVTKVNPEVNVVGLFGMLRYTRRWGAAEPNTEPVMSTCLLAPAKRLAVEFVSTGVSLSTATGTATGVHDKEEQPEKQPPVANRVTFALICITGPAEIREPTLKTPTVSDKYTGFPWLST